jgi:threonine 3-dehydrogenase
MSRTMKAVIKASPGLGFDIQQVPIPSIKPDEVLVRVKVASICGSDVHIYKWNEWAAGRVKPPIIVGHEVFGEIVERGEMVENQEVGDLVSLESHVVCNNCFYCRTGHGNLCTNTSIIGVDRDGGFTEFISIPAQNAWKIPDGLSWEVASLLENFGNAVHVAFAFSLGGKRVLVTGCGPVGIMTITVARAIGAQSIYATDISKYRLQLARNMGADLALHANEDDVVEQIMEATYGEGIDVLLEMSGAPPAIEQGFSLLRPGGEVAILGLTGKNEIKFAWDKNIIFKSANVVGILGRRLWDTWYQMTRLLESGSVDLTPIVTHKYKLDEYDKAIETMASGNSGKIVFYP